MHPSTHDSSPRRSAPRGPLQSAFAARRPLVPWRHFQPVEPEEAVGLWQRLLGEATPQGTPRLLYVHVPYCANHCLFCGFYKNRYTPEDTALYTTRLVEELVRGADSVRAQSGPIHAVYLGGGTPSAMSARELHEVLSTIRTHYPLASDCEVTVEGRIAHFEDEKVAASIEAGANRFSIGIQSFDTAVRQRQGRKASREVAIDFVERLVDRGDATVVVDMIFGLPLQTPEVWAQDLLTCSGLGPDGVDIYALNVFPTTPLHGAIARGVVPPAATLHELGPLYAEGVEHFTRAGWSQISNNHFAQTTRERNRYNLLIKSGAETLAFGSGAGGSMGGYSYMRMSDVDAWLGAVDAAAPTYSALLRATDGERVRAGIVGTLERGRIAPFELVRAGASPNDIEHRVLPELHDWCTRGLAEDRGGYFELTTAGRFWSTNLAGQLIDRLHTKTEEQDMNTDASTFSLEALRAHVAQKSDGVLERVAEEYGVPLIEVLRSLPEGLAEERDGAHFVTALQAIATWGEVTVVVHTADAVVEFKGPFPQGSLGHGFYNLRDSAGLSGHLRPDRCARIVFLERPFMGLETAAVMFMNPDGGCMLKVFLRRIGGKALDPDQLAALRALKGQIA